jgi:hypothetical protein
MEKELNKTKWLHVRLSEEEHKKIQAHFKKTTCRKLSEYTRNKMLDKHLTLCYRNQSLDDVMAELIPLRKSLFALSNNFNQAVHKLNTMQQSDYAERWIKSFEQSQMDVVRQVEEASNSIKKIAESWLQNSRQDTTSTGH